MGVSDEREEGERVRFSLAVCKEKQEPHTSDVRKLCSARMGS